MAYKQSIGSRQKNTDSAFRISEGDPVKKNKGVKPYQAIDMADYNKRQQLYSDSLSANTATQNILSAIKNQSGGDWDQDIHYKGENAETPENWVYYDKPKKTSLAITGSSGSKARYATVNRGDKKGNVYLTKEQYDKEMKNKFIKIK